MCVSKISLCLLCNKFIEIKCTNNVLRMYVCLCPSNIALFFVWSIQADQILRTKFHVSLEHYIGHSWNTHVTDKWQGYILYSSFCFTDKLTAQITRKFSTERKKKHIFNNNNLAVWMLQWCFFVKVSSINHQMEGNISFLLTRKISHEIIISNLNWFSSLNEKHYIRLL